MVVCGHVCVFVCVCLTVCGQWCVTRHEVSQLASGVSVSHTKGDGSTAAVGGQQLETVCVHVCA